LLVAVAFTVVTDIANMIQATCLAGWFVGRLFGQLANMFLAIKIKFTTAAVSC